MQKKLVSSSDFFNVSSTLLKLVNVKVLQSQNSIRCYVFRWRFWIANITLLFWWSLQIVYGQQLFRLPGAFDLQKFCFCLSCIFYQLIAFSKLFSIAIFKKKLNKLFIVLDEIHPTSIEEQSINNIPRWLSQTNHFMLRYSSMMTFMIANYCIIPFYNYTKVLLQTGVWKMELPLLLWLPFDTDYARNTTNFYFVYLVDCWLGFSAAIALSACDLLLLAIGHLVCIHYDYIHRTFIEMKPRSDTMAENLMLVKECVIKQNTLAE